MKTDSEGFLLEPAPTPAYRLPPSPAAYAAAHAEAETPRPATPEARAIGCTCKRSPLNGMPGPDGKPWFFPGMDCPVHGGA